MSTTAPPRPTSSPSAGRHRSPRSPGRAGLPTRKRATRGVTDVARGAVAATALSALLVGPPLLLWQLAPLLLPTRLPGIADIAAALTSPDDGTLFLRALSAIAVAAWVSFAAAVIVEALALVRGRRLPRLPLMGIQQRAASGLVASVAVLFVAPAAVAATPVLATAVTAPPSTAASPAPAAPVVIGSATSVAVQVTVHRGDTLWGIAEHHLASGERYPELVEATRGVTQPDGRHLLDADDIYPGWVVMVPQVAETVARPPTGPATPSTATAPDPPTAAPSPTHEAAGTPSAEAAVPAASSPETSASRTLSSPAAPPTPSRTSDQVDVASSADEVPAAALWTIGAGLALSGLTAAGISGLVRRRRQRQQRRRRTGQRLPLTPTPVQAAQRKVHAAQDPFTLEQLDGLLRMLAAQCDLEGTELPDVQSVRLTDDRIELHLRQPSRPVLPFTAAGADEVLWHIQRDTHPHGTATSAEGPSPFPTLTVVGRDLEGGIVLVDLESITELSVIADSGRSAAVADEVEAVLSAVVIDLATSPWAAEADVVVLGTLAGLVATLEVGHVAHTDDVDHLLDQLEVWAADVQRAAQLEPDERSAAARATGDRADALRPRVVVIGTALSAEQAARLARLGSGGATTPLAIVSAHPVTPAAWTLSLEPGARLAVLQPSGLRLSPQQLSAEARHLLATAVQVASAPPLHRPAVDDAPSVDVAAGSDGEQVVLHEKGTHGAPTPVAASELVDDEAASDPETPSEDVDSEVDDDPGPARRAPRVAVLGPVEIQGPDVGAAPSNNLSTMTELVALLALYPNSQAHLVDSLLWPGERVPRNRRNQLISRTRTWLGSDADGTRYLPMASTEGYRLAPGVRSDWDDFREIVGDDPTSAPTDQLVSALGLVRGQPFAGVHPYRYAWADVPKQSMIELVVDVAAEVAERALEAGDASRARWSAAVGLQAEPGSEQLWRAALRAEHLAGNRDAVEGLVRRFTALAEELGDDLEPETHELITRLLPRTPHARGLASEGSRHAS